METSGIVQKLLQITMFGSEWVLWLLIGLSVLSVAVMIERALYFRRTRQQHFSQFCNDLLSKLDAGDLDSAVAQCASSETFEGRVAHAALVHAEKGAESIEKVTNGFMISERQFLDRGLTVLGTLGNNAPFIGLFGTVLGIIDAFHALSLNPAGGSGVVMSGISEALITTAVGLIVAIPAVVAFNTFQRLVKRRLANGEAVQQLLLAHFSRHDKPALKRAS